MIFSLLFCHSFLFIYSIIFYFYSLPFLIIFFLYSNFIFIYKLSISYPFLILINYYPHSQPITHITNFITTFNITSFQYLSLYFLKNYFSYQSMKQYTNFFHNLKYFPKIITLKIIIPFNKIKPKNPQK